MALEPTNDLVNTISDRVARLKVEPASKLMETDLVVPLIRAVLLVRDPTSGQAPVDRLHDALLGVIVDIAADIEDLES